MRISERRRMVLNNRNHNDLEEYLKGAIRIMFALMAAMVIASAIWSCRSVKDVTEVQDEKTEVMRLDLSEVSKVQNLERSLDSEWLNRIVTWNKDMKAVVYDTSKPIDSVTGKRPVLMELMSNETCKDSSAMKNEKETETLMQREDGIAVVVSDSLKEDLKTEKMITKTYSFELMSNLILIGLITGLVIGLGAMWYIKR